jgi:hypothetical protein
MSVNRDKSWSAHSKGAKARLEKREAERRGQHARHEDSHRGGDKGHTTNNHSKTSSEHKRDAGESRSHSHSSSKDKKASTTSELQSRDLAGIRFLYEPPPMCVVLTTCHQTKFARSISCVALCVTVVTLCAGP